MFCMSALTTAMPTVGVRRNAPAPRAAQSQALSAFPAMKRHEPASLGLRSEGASPSAHRRSSDGRHRQRSRSRPFARAARASAPRAARIARASAILSPQ